LEIHVDPENVASCGVPRKFGYVEEGTLRRRLPPLRPRAPRRDELVFALLREEYEASSLASFPLEEFRAAGARALYSPTRRPRSPCSRRGSPRPRGSG